LGVDWPAASMWEMLCLALWVRCWRAIDWKGLIECEVWTGMKWALMVPSGRVVFTIRDKQLQPVGRGGLLRRGRFKPPEVTRLEVTHEYSTTVPFFAGLLRRCLLY
jgi:hypothetical protein